MENIQETIEPEKSFQKIIQENNQILIENAMRIGYQRACIDASRLVSSTNEAIAILNLPK